MQQAVKLIIEPIFEADFQNSSYGYRPNRNAKRILGTYLQRWDIETMHRDLKQDGLGHIFLRKLCKTDLYLRLIVTGRVLLEIARIRSLCKYPRPNNSVEKRKRWV